jgi:hypothetical protein
MFAGGNHTQLILIAKAAILQVASPEMLGTTSFL